MATPVAVTAAQVEAARWLVRDADERQVSIDPKVRMIAKATVRAGRAQDGPVSDRGQNTSEPGKDL